MESSCAIPTELHPRDGRFGAGPSKVRPAQIHRLQAMNIARSRELILGTSHRQPPVRTLVAEIRRMVAELFDLPDGYEVALGNGGASTFWAVATASLIAHRSAHAVCGEFSRSFATEVSAAPFLADPYLIDANPGDAALLTAVDDVDAYAWAHHETSTGVVTPVHRIDDADDALMLVDATSIAGAAPIDCGDVDAYYFSPQKCFGSDGGLWLALLSPVAIERAERINRDSTRWVPRILDLTVALENSRKDQTLNTPALATLAMMHEQLRWMIDEVGGLDACATRCRASSDKIYHWAETRDFAAPFVTTRQWRSPVVATIDFTGVDAAAIARILRANGIVDVEPYRKLGRNQLRIATFPSVETSDVEALLTCIDYVVSHADVTLD